MNWNKYVSALCLVGVGWGLSAVAIDGGRESGNGGGVVVCRDPGKRITSVEFYDIYEARELRNITPKLGDPKLAPVVKVHKLLDAFAKRSPVRAQLYRELVDRLDSDPKEKKVFYGKNLGTIPDSGPAFVPDHCTREQLIIYREPRFPEDGPERYLVNGDLWALLDNDNRAAALLHEAIYRDFSTIAKQTDSVAARYYNSYLFSGKMQTISYPDFIQLHVRSKTGFIDLNGVLAQINPVAAAYSPYNSEASDPSPDFLADGTLETAYLLNWEYVVGKNLPNEYECHLDANPDACFRKKLANVGGLGLPEYSYLERGTKRLAVKGYVVQSAERGWFSSTGALTIFNVSRFQETYSSLSHGTFSWPFNAKSEVDLLACSGSYGSASVTLENGRVRRFGSSPCSLRHDIALVFPPSSGRGDDFQVTVHANDTYPCSNLSLDVIGGVLSTAFETNSCIAPIRVTQGTKLILESPGIRFDDTTDTFKPEN